MMRGNRFALASGVNTRSNSFIFFLSNTFKMSVITLL